MLGAFESWSRSWPFYKLVAIMVGALSMNNSLVMSQYPFANRARIFVPDLGGSGGGTRRVAPCGSRGWWTNTSAEASLRRSLLLAAAVATPLLPLLPLPSSSSSSSSSSYPAPFLVLLLPPQPLRHPELFNALRPAHVVHDGEPGDRLILVLLRGWELSRATKQ